MANLFFDIETIPDGPKPNRENIKVPKNYSDIFAIDNYIDRKVEEEYRKYALIPHKGRIFCISVILELNSVYYPKSFSGRSTEEVINRFVNFIDEMLSQKDKYTLDFIGHNILDFDMPYLNLALRKYKGRKAAWFPNRFHRTIDTMKEFNYGVYGKYIKLEEACRYFNIEIEDTINGSEVYDEYLAGNGDKIIKHCEIDVRKVKELYLKLTN